MFNLTSEARENLGRYARIGLCLMHLFNLAMSQNDIFVENVNNGLYKLVCQEIGSRPFGEYLRFPKFPFDLSLALPEVDFHHQQL